MDNRNDRKTKRKTKKNAGGGQKGLVFNRRGWGPIGGGYTLPQYLQHFFM